MSAPRTHPADLLAGVEVFASLDRELQAGVAAATVPRSYRRGQLLFVEGDPGDSLLVLRSGAVSVFRSAPSGERALLNVVRPPDVLGEVAILDGAARSTSAEALEDTTALSLSRSTFLDLVHNQPTLLDAVLRSLGSLVRRLTDQTADYVFLDLAGRVAKTLVRLAGTSNEAPVVIELSQTQLAEMVGGSRQSVNQALGGFASRGWLHVEGRRVAIDDLAALSRRAGAPH
jgi:CRP/FNR family cyclic AMP-dependent transcriptional regulator